MIVAMSGGRKEDLIKMVVITTRCKPEVMTEDRFVEMTEVRVGAMTVVMTRARTEVMKVEKTIEAVAIDAELNLKILSD